MARRDEYRLLCLLSAMCLLAPAALGQSKRNTTPKATLNPTAVRQLDKEAERLQKEFVDSLEKLADGYEEAGDVDKAQATLGQVLELDPERAGVKERLEGLRNRVFNDNEVEVDVDVARGWVNTGIKLQEGQAVRLEADGSYKLIINATLSPDGVETQDLTRDMVGGVKLGELIGVVFPPPSGKQKPKPGKPFPIGRQKEVTPDESGMLFLKLNIPDGTKSVGSVKVKVSGNFAH